MQSAAILGGLVGSYSKGFDSAPPRRSIQEQGNSVVIAGVGGQGDQGMAGGKDWQTQGIF